MNVNYLTYLFPLVGALITWCTLLVLLRQKNKWALDHPNERSLHTRPVPRFGGLVMMIGIMIALFSLLTFYPAASSALNNRSFLIIILLAFALVAVSFTDDLYHLSIKVRLLAHIIAASIAVFVSGHYSPILTMVLILVIIWMTNLYNFMDGSDGLAGGMTVIGFSTYAVLAWKAGYLLLMLVAVSIALPAVVFLIFNFHPARVFMGDAGSVPIGFLAGIIGLMGWQSDAWPIWVPLVIFSPFMVDATATLFLRLIRRKRIWEAHKEHYYQKLVQMGWGHRHTACAEYLLMAICGTIALYFHKATTDKVNIILAGLLIFYIVVMIQIQRRWNQSQSRLNIQKKSIG